MRDIKYIFSDGILSSKYRRPLLYCGLAVFGSLLYGYDGTYFTAVLNMDKWAEDYGTEISADGSKSFSSSDSSLFTSIIFVGEFVGSLSASMICGWFGRKGGILAACIVSIIGTILQTVLAGNHPIFIVGRLVVGLGIGIISNCVPLYLSEIPPTEIRASIVGSWQCLLALGQIIGAGVGLGTSERTDTGSYRIPICVNLVFVVILLISLFILPESPRYLIYRNKNEKAEKSLWKIHGNRPDAQACVDEQMEAFLRSKEDEAENTGSKTSWGSLAFGSDRKRLICAVGILICQQISGVQYIFSYFTKIAGQLDLGNEYVMTIGIDVVEFGGVICSFFILNRFGRRPLLIYTGIAMTIFLVVMGGLGVGQYSDSANEKAYNNGVLAMYFLYVFVFNLSWGPLAWTVASELSTGRNKEKIMALGTACFWLMAFIVTFTLPYLYDEDKANLKSMVGFIYAFLCFVTVIFVYFFIPETHGRSLEEINFMFDMKVPTKEWESFDCDGHMAANEKRKRFYPEHIENVNTDVPNGKV